MSGASRDVVRRALFARAGLVAGLSCLGLGCAPPVFGIELPILAETRSVVLASEREGVAFDVADPERRAHLETLALEEAENLEIVLYQCTLSELGLEPGPVRYFEDGEPLPPTRCGFSRAIGPESGGTGWELEAGPPERLAELKMRRAAADCFPGRVNRSCTAEADGYHWAPPNPELWREDWGRIVKSDSAQDHDYFGSAVATDGETFVVGIPSDASCGVGVDADDRDRECPTSGAALVYRWTPEGWVREAYLKPSHTHEGQSFGRTVAISGDTILVGAHRDRACNSGINAPVSTTFCTSFGAAFVFRRGPDGWRQEAFLKASTPKTSDWFGEAVALSKDLALVSAPGQDSCEGGLLRTEGAGDCTNTGAIYVFRRTEAGWRQEWVLKSGQPQILARLGRTLSFEAGVLVAGTTSPPACAAEAERESVISDCLGSGFVEVFKVDGTGGWRWLGAAEVPNRGLNAEYLATSATDGRHVFVGNPGEPSCRDPEPAVCTTPGSVLAYRIEGDELVPARDLEQRFDPPAYGFGVALSAAGDRLLVGILGLTDCPSPPCVRHGGVLVYRLGESGAELADYRLVSRQAAISANFGAALAIRDGYAVVGAPRDPFCGTTLDGEGDPANCVNDGAVYIFEPSFR